MCGTTEVQLSSHCVGAQVEQGNALFLCFIAFSRVYDIAAVAWVILFVRTVWTQNSYPALILLVSILHRNT